MASIDTLVEDIYKLLETGIEVTDEQADRFAKSIAETVKSALTKREARGTLRMSNIGTPCERKLYYAVNQPEDGEPIDGKTYMKFLTGHLLEEAMLFLSELAGHEVTGRQDESDLYGIKGHRDAVIDGRIVDVKSASSYSFKKFESGGLGGDDPFGYIPQLMGYLEAGQTDPSVTDKSQASFLVIDKALGHICLDTHTRPDWDWEEVLKHKKDMVACETPPDRGYEPVAMGAKGNEKLPVFCSYCSFKKTCYPEVRTFLYSTGPVFLTKVVDIPKVFEVDGPDA